MSTNSGPAAAAAGAAAGAASAAAPAAGAAATAPSPLSSFQTIQEIKALKIRYSRADESHIFAMLEEGLNDAEKLTERERDVAELAAQGLHNNEIAERLYISENTVKRHLKVAFQKLNIDRRSRLIEMLR